MEVIYGIDWALKIAMKGVLTSAGTTVNYEYNGRTDVKTYAMENGEKVESGKCFRTSAAFGECEKYSCRDGYAIGSEGQCVPADTFSTVSCEYEYDINGDDEKV